MYVPMLSVTLTICIEPSVMADEVMVLHDILCDGSEGEIEGRRERLREGGRGIELIICTCPWRLASYCKTCIPSKSVKARACLSPTPVEHTEGQQTKPLANEYLQVP